MGQKLIFSYEYVPHLTFQKSVTLPFRSQSPYLVGSSPITLYPTSLGISFYCSFKIFASFTYLLNCSTSSALRKPKGFMNFSRSFFEIFVAKLSYMVVLGGGGTLLVQNRTIWIILANIFNIIDCMFFCFFC